MIAAEIKVNGVLIGYLYIHNESLTVPVKDGKDPYTGEFYEVGKGTVIPFTCRHAREDGALKLINIAIEVALKIIKKTDRARKKLEDRIMKANNGL